MNVFVLLIKLNVCVWSRRISSFFMKMMVC